MLKIIGTSPFPFAASSANSGQVVEVIDLDAGQVPTGRAQYGVAKVEYNRIAGVADRTDSLFTIDCVLFEGGPDPLDEEWRERRWLRRETAGVVTDDDPSSWEAVSVWFEIPADARSLMAHLKVVENVFNDDTDGAIEFEGHFVDSASTILCR